MPLGGHNVRHHNLIGLTIKSCGVHFLFSLVVAEKVTQQNGVSSSTDVNEQSKLTKTGSESSDILFNIDFVVPKVR